MGLSRRQDKLYGAKNIAVLLPSNTRLTNITAVGLAIHNSGKECQFYFTFFVIFCILEQDAALPGSHSIANSDGPQQLECPQIQLK